MSYKLLKSLLLFVTMLLLNFSYAEENQLAKLDWKSGPAVQSIDSRSTIFVPSGYTFLSVKETDKYSELVGNAPTGIENLFAPESGEWDSYFSFNPSGYVKDNDEIDANELLSAIKAGDKSGNKYRRERGLPTFTTLGWEFEPRYDRSNNLLEWAFILQDDETKAKTINYNTRILGREGVMNVVLAVAQEKLHSAVTDFKDKLKGFKYNSGEKYSEYREGDKVAEYGLAALIAGGAAALASKKGFWATIVAFIIAAKKFVFIAVIGLLLWIGSLFKRK